MASNGTPILDGCSAAGLGASPGRALGSSQGDGLAGRGGGPGVVRGVSPVDQGIDSGVLTSGSTVSPATQWSTAEAGTPFETAPSWAEEDVDDTDSGAVLWREVSSCH